MKSKFKSLTVITVYGLGLLSLAITDAFVGKYFDASEVSEWAILRSIFGISAVLSLTGFDQLLIRDRARANLIFRTLIVQIPAISVVTSMVLYVSGLISSMSALIGITIGSSVIAAISNYLRSHSCNFRSQISQQSWRFLSLIVVLSSTAWKIELSLVEMFSIAVIGGAVISVFFAYFHSQNRSFDQEFSGLSEMYRIGFGIMGAAILLNFSIFAEQIVVALLGTKVESASYFIHATYFLLPSSVIAGYLAFSLSTIIRDNPAKVVTHLLSRRRYLLAATAVYFFCVYVIGSIGWAVVNPISKSHSQTLGIIFSLLAVLRLGYTLPAQYVAILGTWGDQRASNVFQVTSIAISTVIFIVLYMLVKADLMISVAFASLGNAIGRLAFGGVMIMRIFNRKSSGEMDIAYG